MNSSHLVIAIDGPAASGKSSVARALARKLGFVYVNTGAMYRAVTWLAVSKNVPPQDPVRMQQLLHFTEFQCGIEDGVSTIRLDGVDPSPFLVSEAVNANVSAVASLPEVRRLLVAKQRALGAERDIVMEGRDIGSAVFPETPFKFYIDASPEVRAMRRARQGLQDSISARDKIDSTRRNSPLIIAEDAHVIDSSNLTVEGVVGEIFGRLKQKGLPLGEL
ncbi:MAG TPA: (d)CMP kinase, partial [Chthoniobacteraceae bacterium]|nr:(d)CMP kinase [Chthoniobacteraceae bacterium]